MKLNIVDAIEILRAIAVSEGNLEIMVIQAVDGRTVAQRGFAFHVVDFESDGRVRKVCAFMQDLDESDKAANDDKLARKKQRMN